MMFSSLKPKPAEFHVFDTTLRDGSQQEGLSLSVTDRLRPSCWDPSRSVVSNTWNSAGLGLSEENISGSLHKWFGVLA